jgi:hypothetical protein
MNFIYKSFNLISEDHRAVAVTVDAIAAPDRLKLTIDIILP